MRNTCPSNEEIENVSNALRQLAGSPERCALLVIDVQKEFCDPQWRGNDETISIAGQIATLAPAFREAGATLYAIYISSVPERNFHRFIPDEESDIIVPKDDESAFRGSNIQTLLKKNGHTHILACGFNLSACVKETAKDACKKKYDTTLLKDLTGNGRVDISRDVNTELSYYRKTGCRLASASDILAGEHVFHEKNVRQSGWRAMLNSLPLRF